MACSPCSVVRKVYICPFDKFLVEVYYITYTSSKVLYLSVYYVDTVVLCCVVILSGGDIAVI